METADPIVALATASGRAAIGVVRLSGAGLVRLLEPLLGRLIPPRVATLVDFLDADGEPLDSGLALFFPAPHSYTGEDVLELQGHGGPAVIQSLLRRCLELGVRLAEPGEFTRRAFLNNKLDLAQAESVADLIDAGSAAAAKSALRSLRGEFSERVREIADKLTQLRLMVEASIDFPDEEVEVAQGPALGLALTDLRGRIEELVRIARAGRLLRDGAQVVLIGRPNVGKSSLLNQLVGEDIAIVSDTPGTTRDALREAVVIDGVPMHIIDTAGLRETASAVERLGIARTRAAMERADLALIVLDSSQPVEAGMLAEIEVPDRLPRLVVWNKIDLTGDKAQVVQRPNISSVWLSARTGEGMKGLKAEILRSIGFDAAEEGIFLARERHLDALRRALEHLNSADHVRDQTELLAEGLRLSHDALGAITGRLSADDLLGEIFSRFCIGK